MKRSTLANFIEGSSAPGKGKTLLDPVRSARDHGSNEGLDSGQSYRLIYISASLLPALDSGGDRDVLGIFKASRSRNQRLGITGALTYHELHFAQVLEGTRENVSLIFRSIQRDRRHAKVVVVEEGWIGQRDFVNWAMAYVGDRGSLRLIATNLQWRDIIANESRTALLLLEMMKFFLLRAAPNP